MSIYTLIPIIFIVLYAGVLVLCKEQKLATSTSSKQH